MTLFGTHFSIAALWLIAGLVLAIFELIAPGFFLVFVAAGAALTGLVVLAAPDLHAIAQALIFAGFGALAVGIGRRWYHRSPSSRSTEQLNDRTARLIGRTVEVSQPIVAGEGRVTVGDGAWNATGPDLPAGTMVRIIGANGAVLSVEPA